MRRRLALILPIAVALAGAGVAHGAESTRSGFREISDAAGRAVKVPAAPARVLSLCTSATDTMLRLGQGSRLAGIDEYSRVVPGAADLAVLGKGSAISREQVLARGIDLAFVWWFQADVADLLGDLRVPVVMLRCGRAAEVPATIRLIGQCLGLADAGETLAAGVAEALEGLASTNDRSTRVYLELYSPFKTGGRDTYVNDLIALAGGRNVAADVTGPVLLSSERLLAADPECVVLVAGFGTPDQFARRGGLGGLSAVRAGRVHLLDRYSLVAGAGLPEGVAALRRLLEPTPVP